VPVKGHPNKKRVKKTIIEEILKRIKQILAKRGCLSTTDK
jgi:hypothetical protein